LTPLPLLVGEFFLFTIIMKKRPKIFLRSFFKYHLI